MPLEPLPVSDSFLTLIDRVGYSHRSIDAKRRANGDRRVSVRVTDAQYELLKERATTARLSVADYVRHVLQISEVTTV
jgi:hypothetical protein